MSQTAKELEPEIRDPLVSHSTTHTVYSMDCWQDLVRNHGFPLKFTSFLWLSPTISLELSWNLQHPLPTSRKELYFTAPAGAAEIKRAWLLWSRKILLSHFPLNATYKYDVKFQRNILNMNECRYDMIRYQRYQIGHRLQRKNHLRILARSIAIPRIGSFTTQSGLWSPAVTPRATATPLKSENSREKLLGTSGRDGC